MLKGIVKKIFVFSLSYTIIDLVFAVHERTISINNSAFINFHLVTLTAPSCQDVGAKKETTADRSTGINAFSKGPVSAYLHFIKTASRRCPNINLNSKRYCEFRGLQPPSLAARDDADADMPPAAMVVDPRTAISRRRLHRKAETAFRYLVDRPLPFHSSLLFPNSLFCLDPSGDVSAREQTCLQLHQQ